jgi:hypothetical protein
MRKLWGTLASLVVGCSSLVVLAAPAQASCQTELGDMCHAYGVICRSAVDQAPALGKFVDCPNW